MTTNQKNYSEVFYSLNDPRASLVLQNNKIVSESSPHWLWDFVSHSIKVECVSPTGRVIAVRRKGQELTVKTIADNPELANNLMRAYHRGRMMSRRHFRNSAELPTNIAGFAELAGYDVLTPERNFFNAGFISLENPIQFIQQPDAAA
ncbi:hypothetical protein [Endozoicomonas lisbonensis]|uniref:Uncharacterized protein n=1 Tax=Endozoicomonas lisbonensis TaxID=3120522 RepID=A0ABV2SPB0_9GAMM